MITRTCESSRLLLLEENFDRARDVTVRLQERLDVGVHVDEAHRLKRLDLAPVPETRISLDKVFE